jgi:transcriptional regulator with GAF, ATPase, and Fis domain
MRVWYKSVFATDDRASESIFRSLLQAGIETVPIDADDVVGPGIVLFDTVNAQVYAVIRALTTDGNRRVLVLSTSNAALVGDQSWRLLMAGASDALSWNDPALSSRAVAARLERWAEVDRIMLSPAVQDQLVGHSPCWLATLRQAVEVGCFTDAPVLVTGESGTGKELVARLIHSLDRRHAKRQLVVLDCSTIVAQLSGSEFFGHERGAFTGAIAPRDGAFALADGGTLFLDEVGELSLDMQMQLLRVVQEHTYKRVGGNNWKSTEFRLICATNRDLDAEVEAGRFRADLYYRIAGVRCHLPSLRDRGSDIPELIAHFLKRAPGGCSAAGVDEPVMRWLINRQYRGNIRELSLVLTRMLYRHTGSGPVTVGDVPEEERETAPDVAAAWEDVGFVSAISRAVSAGVRLKEIGHAAEEVAERMALLQANGNIHQAAAQLGVTDRALQLRRAARRDRLVAPRSAAAN